MGIPQLRSEGNDQGGSSATLTVDFNSFTWALNDIIEIVVTTDGTIPTLSNAQGFQLAIDVNGNAASISTNGGVAGANETATVIFWKRALGSTVASDPSPTIAFNGATSWCLEPNSYSGCRTSGTPYHQIVTGTQLTATTAVTSPNLTSTLANCLFLGLASSSEDDSTFNNWTMTGSAGPSGSAPPSYGWHNGAGNHCSFTGSDGGYATAGGPHNGTTTFGTATKQALIGRILASLPEVVNTGWYPAQTTIPSRSMLATAALAGMFAPVMAISNPPPLSWAPSYPDAAPRARCAVLTGGAAMPELPQPNPVTPPLSWLPVAPDIAQRARGALLVGGMAAPEATLAAPATPVLSWAPRYPDMARSAPAARIAGGNVAPEATIPNAAPPVSSWLPIVPDFASRPRAVVIVGGGALPDATLPNAPSPLLAWAPRYPDAAPRARQPVIDGGGVQPVAPVTAPGVLGIGATAFFEKANTTTPFPGTISTPAVYPAWAPSTTEALINDPRVTNAGNAYELATSGTTASSGGPTTTPAPVTNGAITDGTAKWNFLAAGTGAVNTQASGSIILVSLGTGNDSTSGTAPRDNKGNTYSLIGSKSFFAGFPTSSAATYSAALPASGGTGHTFQADYGAGADFGGDEKTIAAVEVVNAFKIQDHSSVEASPNGSGVCTSNPVTTTQGAVLICFCWLNGVTHADGFLHPAVPGNGFAQLPLASGLLEIANGAGQVQMETIFRVVATAGTYTATINTSPTSPPEGAIMHLIAVQGPDIPQAPPLSWAPVYPHAASRASMRPHQGGLVAPPADTTTAPLVWGPTYPDRAPGPARAQPGGAVAPPTDTTSAPLAWAPSYPSLAPAQRRAPEAGATAPPSDVTTVPLAWSPAGRDWVPTRPRALALSDVVEPVLVVAAPTIASWAPSFPGAVSRHRARLAGGAVQPEATLPNPPTPVLSWGAVYPDVAPLPRAPVIVGGAAQPEATLPNAPAPLESWLPVYPGYQLRHRARAALSEGQAVLPILESPALSWGPVYPDRAYRAPAAALTGGMSAPEDTLPNAPAPILSWAPVFPDCALVASSAADAGFGGCLLPLLPIEVADPITTVEDAIHAWVVAGSGLAADHVIWVGEGVSAGQVPGQTPAGMYISLRIHEGESVSDDWLVDEVVNGQVITHVQGTFHPMLEITCYSGGRYGSSRGVLLLRRVMATAAAPDIARILRLGRVGMGTYNKIRTIDGNRSTMFDPRVIVEVQLHLAIDVARPADSIDTVSADVGQLGTTITVTRPPG